VTDGEHVQGQNIGRAVGVVLGVLIARCGEQILEGRRPLAEELVVAQQRRLYLGRGLAL
jgi:hypothetical protein